MAASRAAIRYAKATLNLALEQKLNDQVETDMLTIQNTLAESTDLQNVLNSPVIKGEEKKNALKKIFANTQEITKGLIGLLIANKRINELGEVAMKYRILNQELKGKDTAVVTTAVPLSNDLEKKLLEKVKNITGKDVSIKNQIDESILGGFILRVGDLQFDASIANKLTKLKRDFTSEAYISKI
ncbi:MAG: ATP synthase F1 subunit delta [Flavobacteriaceae bacterium]|nr:ATP synthase F1 subunit delta [Flavobacteriaceae bacterium]